MDGGKGGTRGGVGSLPRDAAREEMRESASEKGYQMATTRDWALAFAVALFCAWGWRIVAWPVCALMGWA